LRPARNRDHHEDDACRVALQIDAEELLEISEPVVATKAHVVPEERQHQRVAERLRDDREVDAGHARAERQPAKDERERGRHQRHHHQREREVIEPEPEPGSSFQLRKTMKSGSNGFPYTPRGPIWRIRYMPIA